MKKSVFLLSFFGLFIIFSSFSLSEIANTEDRTTDVGKNYKDIAINISPATAQIREAGPQGPIIGNSGITITMQKNTSRRFWITASGYIPQVLFLDFKCGNRRSCQAKYDGLSAIQNINMVGDPVHQNSTESVDVNRDVILRVEKGRSQEEAWEKVQSTILSYFDVLEADDVNSGYLRTAWVGHNYNHNTTRERVIVKKVSKNPITYKLKFVVEESGYAGTSYSADNQFRPYGRIPKKYSTMIGQLMTGLK